MKKNKRLNQILSALLTVFLTAAIVPLSVNAEELRFGIFEVYVDGLDTPAGYETPDFDVSLINAAPYTVYDVRWTNISTGEYMASSDEFISGHEYTVDIVLEANPSYYFLTDDFGYPTVSGSLNGDAAEVSCAPSDVIQNSSYDSYELAAQKLVSVRKTFTAEDSQNLIETLDLSVTAPMPESFPTYWCRVAGGTPSWVDSLCVEMELVWREAGTGRILDRNETFKYGTLYTASIYLTAKEGYFFAEDPNQTAGGKPFTAVCGTINGSPALVETDYGKGEAKKHIVISREFECNTVTPITEVNLDITAPKTGSSPTYVIVVTGKGMELAESNSTYEKNGISWTVTGGMGIPTQGFTFEVNSLYSVSVRINALPGFEFVDPTVTVNGKPAQLIPGKDSIVIGYDFPATGNRILSTVSVTDLDAPQAGASPDYTAELLTYGCELGTTADASHKNGIYWYNETAKKPMRIGIDKFEEGNVYSVTISLTAKEGYEFSFKDGVTKVTGYVNGVRTENNYARSEAEVFVTYTFPAVGTGKIGDINGDGTVSIEDSIALFQHSMIPDLYPLNYTGSVDFNKDGVVDIGDSILLFQHSMLPDLYPLD